MRHHYLILMSFYLICLLLNPLCASALTLKGHLDHQDIETTVSPQPDFGIIGVEFLLRPKRAYPIILQVYPNTPAAKSGLLPGDEILTINHLDTKVLSAKQVDLAISDKPGDKVQMLVRRDDSEFITTITVGSIHTIHSQAVLSLYGY